MTVSGRCTPRSTLPFAGTFSTHPRRPRCLDPASTVRFRPLPDDSTIRYDLCAPTTTAMTTTRTEGGRRRPRRPLDGPWSAVGARWLSGVGGVWWPNRRSRPGGRLQDEQMDVVAALVPGRLGEAGLARHLALRCRLEFPAAPAAPALLRTASPSRLLPAPFVGNRIPRQVARAPRPARLGRRRARVALAGSATPLSLPARALAIESGEPFGSALDGHRHILARALGHATMRRWGLSVSEGPGSAGIGAVSRDSAFGGGVGRVRPRGP